ncbi:MAG: transcription antitermination factor NusB [Spirochaetes bacterium]|nr:transcription antitermination factor NusB [Spirochaetota bacterium]
MDKNEIDFEKIKENLEENKIIIPDRRISRILVLKALYQYYFLPELVDEIGSFKWVKKSYNDFIFQYSKMLYYGVIRNKEAIDNIIKKFSKRIFDQIDLIDKIILEFSIYQMMEDKKLKHKIIIDEAIEISKAYSNKNAYKFINGILDAYSKELQNKI